MALVGISASGDMTTSIASNLRNRLIGENPNFQRHAAPAAWAVDGSRAGGLGIHLIANLSMPIRLADTEAAPANCSGSAIVLATMEAHEIPDLDPQPRDSDGHGYIDFLASKELSVGLAIWPAGATDRQRPHREDEVYYVISGRGEIRVADEERYVKSGSLVFVAAGVEHRFHNIEEDLRVLVFWAPPHTRS